MGLIDTYQIATMGYNSKISYTIASLGILYDVSIRPVPPPIPPIPVPPATGDDNLDEFEEDDDLEHYEITVTATVDGQEYTETKIVQSDITVTVSDLKLDFDQDSKKVIINMI
mgnify:CR=1 FL=1